MSVMTPKQVKLLDTAVLKLMDIDLRKVIPERQRDLQALQREAVWVKRELKARNGYFRLGKGIDASLAT